MNKSYAYRIALSQNTFIRRLSKYHCQYVQHLRAEVEYHYGEVEKSSVFYLVGEEKARQRHIGKYERRRAYHRYKSARGRVQIIPACRHRQSGAKKQSVAYHERKPLFLYVNLFRQQGNQRAEQRKHDERNKRGHKSEFRVRQKCQQVEYLRRSEAYHAQGEIAVVAFFVGGYLLDRQKPVAAKRGEESRKYQRAHGFACGTDGKSYNSRYDEKYRRQHFCYQRTHVAARLVQYRRSRTCNHGKCREYVNRNIHTNIIAYRKFYVNTVFRHPLH